MPSASKSETIAEGKSQLKSKYLKSKHVILILVLITQKIGGTQLENRKLKE